LEVTGPEGGPFVPSTAAYTLTNGGDTTLTWRATNTTDWTSITPDSGTLSRGQAVAVSISINTNAQLLTPATYFDLVNFINTSTDQGGSNILITLTVTPSPGTLSVGPEEDLTITGHSGGPFTPMQQVYALTNSGGQLLNWTASADVAWLTVHPTNGSLAPGEQTLVTLALTEEANTLLVGAHDGHAEFHNTTSVSAAMLRTVHLNIGATVVLEIRLSDNPDEVVLTVHGMADTDYVLQTTTDLSNWLDGVTYHTDALGEAVIVQAVPADPGFLAYRLKAL
jgi:hypothetical protein